MRALPEALAPGDALAASLQITPIKRRSSAITPSILSHASASSLLLRAESLAACLTARLQAALAVAAFSATPVVRAKGAGVKGRSERADVLELPELQPASSAQQSSVVKQWAQNLCMSPDATTGTLS
jgi:hypothetical protein